MQYTIKKFIHKNKKIVAVITMNFLLAEY